MPEYHQVEATVVADLGALDLDGYRAFLRRVCPGDDDLHRWAAGLSLQPDGEGFVHAIHPRPVVQLRQGELLVRAEPYVYVVEPSQGGDGRAAAVFALLLWSRDLQEGDPNTVVAYKKGVEPLIERVMCAAYDELGSGHAILSDEISDGVTAGCIRGESGPFFAFDLALLSSQLVHTRSVPDGFRSRSTTSGPTWVWAEGPWRTTPWDVADR